MRSFGEALAGLASAVLPSVCRVPIKILIRVYVGFGTKVISPSQDGSASGKQGLASWNCGGDKEMRAEIRGFSRKKGFFFS